LAFVARQGLLVHLPGVLRHGFVNAGSGGGTKVRGWCYLHQHWKLEVVVVLARIRFVFSSSCGD